MSEVVLVRVNCASRREADTLAEAVVAEGLAPCANIDAPVSSIYRWKGAVERAEEHVVWFKAARAAWPRLEARIRALHSAETPAILALPCAEVHEPYADWLVAETKS